MKKEKCKWIVRPGWNNSYWAYIPCKKGFNYLSKISKAKDIKNVYDGRICPICNNIIECNTELLMNEENEYIY